MDFFETTAKYAYRQSLKILTWRDLAVAFAIFIVSLLVGVIMRKQKGWKWKTVSYFSLLFPYIYLFFDILFWAGCLFHHRGTGSISHTSASLLQVCHRSYFLYYHVTTCQARAVPPFSA